MCPTYCYSSEDGGVIERFFKMGEAPKRVIMEETGKVFRRDFAVEQVGVPAKAGWPIECYASGVNAAQAGELRDHFKKQGVSCEVTQNGDPIYTSHEHRKKALACRGIHDRNSFN